MSHSDIKSQNMLAFPSSCSWVVISNKGGGGNEPEAGSLDSEHRATDAGPPYGPICPWLALGGLIFTALLMVWGINGAFIIGIFFTM